MDPGTLQQFKTIIEALMSPDNNIRGQAEAEFNKWKSGPPDVFLTCLVTLLKAPPAGTDAAGGEQVRSLCAVLLRKAVMQSSQSQPGQSLISILSPAVAEAVKKELLECIQAEPQRNIRKKVCDAVGQLANSLMNTNPQAWPALFPFMLASTTGGNANMHEAALAIFNACAEFIAENPAYKPMLGTLHDVFTRSLASDQAMIVRVAALKTLASFLLALSDPATRKPFQTLVPEMLRTIGDALGANDEAEVRSALEVFVEIAESQPKFLKKNILDCVTGMIGISANTDLEDATRHLALEFLLTVAENAQSTAKKIPQFVDKVVPIALQMMLEIECDTQEELYEWENQEEDDEDTEITNYDVGEEALDRLAIALGRVQPGSECGELVQVLFARIKEMIANADWKHRHAALMAISQSGEGCEKKMKEELHSIVNMIVQHFGDAHPRVRWAAINTVGQMCTDFGPDLQQQLHAKVLPALILTMDDPCKRVQAHAAAAIINFCEHCERKTLKDYLPGLLSKLNELLQRNVRRVAEQAVTAIASVADVAEADFEDYYEHFMPPLINLLRVEGKDYRMLRGKAMECISLIGVAVGKEKFGTHAKSVMELFIASQQGVELEADDPQITFMLQACGRICKCLGEQFAPYLPYVLPSLIKSAQIDPELHVTDADEEEEEEHEGMESVTVHLRGQGHKRITIRTSALEEKATACSMLRTYAQELREAFFPCVQEVANVLVPLIRFQYMDDVRAAAIGAMPELLNCAILAAQKGVPGASAELIAQLKDFMLEPILQQLKTEPDTETLSTLLDAWHEVIDLGAESEAAKLNPKQLHETVAVFQEIHKESIERRNERAKAEEQEELDEEDQDEMAVEMEREEILVQNIVECLGSLFKVYRSALLPLFEQLLLPFFKAMLQPSAIVTDRVAALCVFDDVIEHCSADSVADKYVGDLLPAFLMYATDSATEVRQAAVYGLGVLAEHSRAPTFADQQLGQAAQALLGVIEAPDAFSDDNASASDNAVSALGKLCARSEAIGQAAWPRWLAKLPLRTDQEEARSVHRKLVELCETTNANLLGAANERLPDVVIVFGQVLETELIDEETSTRICNLLKQVRNGLPHVLGALPTMPAFANLAPEQRGALERAISS